MLPCFTALVVNMLMSYRNASTRPEAAASEATSTQLNARNDRGTLLGAAHQPSQSR